MRYGPDYVMIEEEAHLELVSSGKFGFFKKFAIRFIYTFFAFLNLKLFERSIAF